MKVLPDQVQVRFVLGPGDGVMVRKQLLTLARHLGN